MAARRPPIRHAHQASPPASLPGLLVPYLAPGHLAFPIAPGHPHPHPVAPHKSSRSSVQVMPHYPLPLGASGCPWLFPFFSELPLIASRRPIHQRELRPRGARRIQRASGRTLPRDGVPRPPPPSSAADESQARWPFTRSTTVSLDSRRAPAPAPTPPPAPREPFTMTATKIKARSSQTTRPTTARASAAATSTEAPSCPRHLHAATKASEGAGSREAPWHTQARGNGAEGETQPRQPPSLSPLRRCRLFATLCNASAVTQDTRTAPHSQRRKGSRVHLHLE